MYDKQLSEMACRIADMLFLLASLMAVGLVVWINI